MKNMLYKIEEIETDIENFKKDIVYSLSNKEKYELIIEINKEEKEFIINEILRVFDMPLSTYYYHKNKKENKDKGLITCIKNISIKHKSYGKRRIKDALEKKGYSVGVYKIARLMKQEKIKAAR